ncbi:uncharacterized protein LOC100572631 isoform X2 [Acyrthosiphon pisum]|nr:uncharacterized protein LOC100572631 isoform X2 [Acyrthosiphon pisum]XP_016662178.1 uncharacterized protein LOC100572631 isoform X2 [Acyrthosiphon pisum]XP_029343568.1 uncharacterized protein LOC100572631 isoform X2 [Acyrthosiphon pisum]XP_029343569.1 uncharacterized protein LOC100572631 isoform X2 [Acyrthosiphon pisum]|eukprot:XP_003246378.1 PREDICTED: uncharacterized protein LOC100572631 isoform X2 [Acyrthosiphon pisum]
MNGVMADCRKYSKNEYFMNHNSKNRHLLLILIYTMALIFESHGTTLGTDLNNENCSDALTCTKCTIKAQCAWSLEKQKCVNYNHFHLSNLTIYGKEKCPRFSVVKKYEYNNTINHLEYIVKVSNDHVNFMKYLKESKFLCNSTTIDVYNKTIKNDEIICSANILTTNFKLHGVQSFTAFIYIKFNKVLLCLDNIADHYVTFYEHECAEDKKDENCATCTWNKYGFAHYIRLCSSGNSCEGRNELYLWHNDVGKSWNSKTREVNNQCAEINVTSIDPLSGTMAGGTTITITVKNHLILADNRTVMVVVAGMLCADPRTSGPETITCITTPPTDDTLYAAPSGSVLVKYTSHERQLIIESSQKFHYYVDISAGTSLFVINLHIILIQFSFFVFYTKMVY